MRRKYRIYLGMIALLFLVNIFFGYKLFIESEIDDLETKLVFVDLDVYGAGKDNSFIGLYSNKNLVLVPLDFFDIETSFLQANYNDDSLLSVQDDVFFNFLSNEPQLKLDKIGLNIKVDKQKSFIETVSFDIINKDEL